MFDIIKKPRLRDSTLEITIQEDESDTMYMLMKDSEKVFKLLQEKCINL
jgi:hypothetical protein